jgi:hypothetical protein
VTVDGDDEPTQTARLVVDVVCTAHFVTVSVRSEDANNDVPSQVATFHMKRETDARMLAACVSSGVSGAIARGGRGIGPDLSTATAVQIVAEVARHLRIGANDVARSTTIKKSGLGRAANHAGDGGGQSSQPDPADDRQRPEFVVADAEGR